MTLQRSVITPYGVGTCPIDAQGPEIPVTLEAALKRRSDRVIDLMAHEVFDFSDHALVRVIRKADCNFMSTMQFFSRRSEAEEALVMPGPTDEWRFLLDLRTGKMEAHGHNLASAQRFIYLEPQVNGWFTEPYRGSSSFDKLEEAKSFFEKTSPNLLQTSDIASAVLIDTEAKHLVRLMLAGTSNEPFRQWPQMLTRAAA